MTSSRKPKPHLVYIGYRSQMNRWVCVWMFHSFSPSLTRKVLYYFILAIMDIGYFCYRKVLIFSEKHWDFKSILNQVGYPVLKKLQNLYDNQGWEHVMIFQHDVFCVVLILKAQHQNAELNWMNVKLQQWLQDVSNFSEIYSINFGFNSSNFFFALYVQACSCGSWKVNMHPFRH